MWLDSCVLLSTCQSRRSSFVCVFNFMLRWQRVLPSPSKGLLPGVELTGPLPISHGEWEDVYSSAMALKSPEKADTIRPSVAHATGGSSVSGHEGLGNDESVVLQSTDGLVASRSDSLSRSAAIGIGLIGGLAIGGAAACAVAALASKQSRGKGRRQLQRAPAHQHSRVGACDGSSGGGGGGAAATGCTRSAAEPLERRGDTAMAFQMAC